MAPARPARPSTRTSNRNPERRASFKLGGKLLGRSRILLRSPIPWLPNPLAAIGPFSLCCIQAAGRGVE
jgi:hypothetical protein